MKAIGYGRCPICGGIYQAYAPRHWTAGEALHIWSHTDDTEQSGWGRLPKCAGSYQASVDSRLSTDMEGNAPVKNRHAVALGRLGGASTSPAKAVAARANGRRGGRPRTKDHG